MTTLGNRKVDVTCCDLEGEIIGTQPDVPCCPPALLVNKK